MAFGEDAVGFNGIYSSVALDNQGNVHMVHANADWNDVYYSQYDGESWSSPRYLANSSPIWLLYNYPSIAVGPNNRPHAVYGQNTGGYPNDLNYFTYAYATDDPCTSWTYVTIGNDGLRRAMMDLTVDDSNQPHIVFQTTNKYSPFWYRITYRSPSGTEQTIQQTWDPTQCTRPSIAYRNGIVHIAWYQNGNGSTNIFYASSADGFNQIQQLTNNPWGWNVESPGIAVAPNGTVEIVFVIADWNGSHPHYLGLYHTRPGWSSAQSLGTGQAALNEYFEDFWPPNVAFDSNNNRYISWYHWAENEHYHMINDQAKVTHTPQGHIDVCAGPAGAYYVRNAGLPGPMYVEQLAGGGANIAPTISVLSPPSGNAEANLSYQVTWTDSDPDDNATISLYYDTNNIGFNGTLIPGAGSIAEDPEGGGDTFTWDISNQPDDAKYWVYGVINDGTNPVAQDYSPGYLFINHVNDSPYIQLNTPATNDTADASSYSIQWSDGDPDDNALISLFYAELDSPNDSTQIVSGINENNATDAYSWDVSSMDPGTYRIYAIIDDGELTTGDHSTGTVTILTTMEVYAIDDASVYRDWEPNHPHGALPDLDVGADDLGEPDELAYFRFTIPSIEYGVVSATLNVHCVDEGGGGGAHTVNHTDWTEETLTWNNKPGIGGTAMSTIEWVYPDNWYSYDVTPHITGEGTFAIALRSETPNGAHFASKENTNSSLKPYLHIVLGGEPQEYPPTAQIDSIVPNPVIQGYHETVAFYGTGWDNDEGGESIIQWKWTSNQDDQIGSTESFSLDPEVLSIGNHVIRFWVQDDELDWSTASISNLEVRAPDNTPPTWTNGTGLRAVTDLGTGGNVRLFWNEAVDVNPPVTYNVYWDTLPSPFSGTKLEDVSWVQGTGYYDCMFTLGGFENGITYYFAVRAEDMVGNEDQNETIRDITLSDQVPPQFTSGPSVSGITSNSAIVSWTTDEVSTGTVGYWITPDESLNVDVSSPALNHQVVLMDLTPGITYFYRVYVADQYENQGMSDIESFMTEDSPIYSYQPTDDAYVVSWEPGENFGSTTRLIVEQYEVSYLKFSVPDVGLGVNNAYLRITCSAEGDTATIRSVGSNDWNEESITWNNKPLMGGVITGISSPEEGVQYDVDVSSWISAPGTYSIGMNAPTRSICMFYSKEYNNSSERPYLVVHYREDSQSPSMVTDLSCHQNGSDLILTWSPSTDNLQVVGYRVYRSSQPYFEPLPRNLVASPMQIEYIDVDVLGNPDLHHYYIVTAYDAANNESDPSPRVGEMEFDTVGD